MTTSQPADPTRAGNYFFSNYPAYSFWDAEQLPEVERVLASAPPTDTPLILYVHIPFCRQRCEFCFFKVYTGKSSSEVRSYLDALLAELETAARAPYLQGRCPDYVYFGGGTPSYLSSDQLSELFAAIQTHMGWEGVKEVAFECEPGTVKESKLQRLRDLGVTRLSLGVEHYDDKVLEVAGRAHRQEEIYAAFEAARKADFSQINIDLIAGMVGETEEGWQDCIDRTLALNPDSITVYQMEVPHNTTIYQRMQEGSDEVAPVADWETKRRWVAAAFEAFEGAGFKVGSAYTAYRGENTRFMYRDALWHGADMLGVGVSSFSHLGGVHVQNHADLEAYEVPALAGEAPHWRAFSMNEDERWRRMFLLQLKLGQVDPGWFASNLGVNPAQEYDSLLARHRAEGWVAEDAEMIRLTRDGLLRIDSLIAEYIPAEFRTSHVV
jgi:oxygen-independent coproporphyrinogen-3 oxidase